MIELGKTYRDGPTGVEGVATGRAEYLGGSVKVLLEWRKAGGDPVEHWFAETRLIEGPQKAVGFRVAHGASPLRSSGNLRDEAAAL